MKQVIKCFAYGGQQMVLETGVIAKQATGAVMVSLGDTKLLVTVVAEKVPSEERDFFPLTVNYQERYYANGRLPGGFIKREARPGVSETLIARLIDRPLRPLFPEGFTNEVQVVITLMSLDPQIAPDIPALIGAAAALEISGIPFGGPLAAARVGYENGQYLLNPTAKQLETSALDLVVAGTETAILMVESEARELSEEVMLGAVMFGHREMQQVVKMIHEFAAEVGVKKWDFAPAVQSRDYLNEVHNLAYDRLVNAYNITEKLVRFPELEQIRESVAATMIHQNEKRAREYCAN